MATLSARIKLLAQAIGTDIKAVRGQIPVVAPTSGQSTTAAVSQKLFTDTVGNIDALLDKINGVVV